jgi:hypothetical protein
MVTFKNKWFGSVVMLISKEKWTNDHHKGLPEHQYIVAAGGPKPNWDEWL